MGKGSKSSSKVGFRKASKYASKIPAPKSHDSGFRSRGGVRR